MPDAITPTSSARGGYDVPRVTGSRADHVLALMRCARFARDERGACALAVATRLPLPVARTLLELREGFAFLRLHVVLDRLLELRHEIGRLVTVATFADPGDQLLRLAVLVARFLGERRIELRQHRVDDLLLDLGMQ